MGKWLAGREERGELSPSTLRGYQDMTRTYLVPHLGHRKLAELRGPDLTAVYSAIVAERRAAIAEATARNKEYASRAAEINDRRRATGRTRMVPARRVAVPRPVGPSTLRRMHACMSAALKAAVGEGRSRPARRRTRGSARPARS